METNEIKVKAECITTFHSFAEWVNKASSRLGGFPRTEQIICIASNGQACNTGREMMYARDNDLFPVIAYRLIKADE